MNQIGLRSVSSLFASTLTFYGHTVMNQIGLSDLCHHLCFYTYILWSYSNEPDWTQICVITLCLYTYILWSYSNEPDWTQICVITLCLYTYILWSYSNEPDWTQICVIIFASTLTFYGHTVMNQIGLSDLCHHLCLYTYILWSYSNEPDWTQICVITLCLYTIECKCRGKEWCTVMNQIGLRSVSSLFASTP